MAERRELVFASLDEVMPDVERLLAGHVTVGQWSLGQICNHLATTIRLTLDAPPSSSEPTREQVALRHRFFRSCKFPEEVEAPLPALHPKPDLDACTEAERLRETIERFSSASGPFAAHPVLGPLSKAEWKSFHCVHSAHHLGFAVAI